MKRSALLSFFAAAALSACMTPPPAVQKQNQNQNDDGPGHNAKEKDDESLSPDQPATIGDGKIAVVSGKIGPVFFYPRNIKGAPYPSKESFFQVKVRITNRAQNNILNYVPWSANVVNNAHLVDEFGNKYRLTGGDSEFIVGGADTKSRRVLPGASVEDLLPFEAPLPQSKDFRLVLPGDAVGRDGAKVTFRLPRAFFDEGK